MSEGGSEELSRLEKLAQIFGHSTQPVELDTGVVIVPASHRPGAYEVQRQGEGAVDIIDVGRFRSVRRLDEYLQQFEGRSAPTDLGRGVA